MKDQIFPQGGRSFARIFLEDICVEVLLGLHPHERGEENRQRILVSVELFADAAPYLKNAGAESIINYDRIRDAVTALAQKPHTLLIETYLKELLPVCFSDKRVAACRLSVSKPDIFPETRAVGVEIFMRREDFEKI